MVWNQKLHTTAGFIIETVLGDYLITGYFSHMIDIAGDTAVVDYLIMIYFQLLMGLSRAKKMSVLNHNHNYKTAPSAISVHCEI